MYNSSGLIPAKFLTLIAHLTISATLLWSSLESVRICLPENYPEDVLLMQQKQLIVGLSVTLGMIAFELLAFLSGVTMFHPTSALLSIICHASACVILCYLVFDSWQCGWYWWIFAFCSVLPVLNDLCIVFDVILKLTVYNEIMIAQIVNKSIFVCMIFLSNRRKNSSHLNYLINIMRL